LTHQYNYHETLGDALVTTNFPKSSRLLNPKQYKFVFDDARYKVANRHCLILARPYFEDYSDLPATPFPSVNPCQNSSKSRLGIVAAKRHIKRAVDRNRFKRLARETYRLKRSTLGDLQVVVLAKAGAGDLSKEQLTDSFNTLWLKLSRRLSE